MGLLASLTPPTAAAELYPRGLPFLLMVRLATLFMRLLAHQNNGVFALLYTQKHTTHLQAAQLATRPQCLGPQALLQDGVLPLLMALLHPDHLTALTAWPATMGGGCAGSSEVLRAISVLLQTPLAAAEVREGVLRSLLRVGCTLL